MQKYIIELSGTKNKIEIDSKSIPKALNWDEAKKACEKLGKGWRLPTKLVNLSLVTTGAQPK